MDERSDDLRNQSGKVEGGYDLGRRQGYELQAPDGERRAGMVWQDARALNETFQIDAPEGFWTERYIDGKMQGQGGGRCKPVTWEGVEYDSIQALANHMGVSRPAALMRLREIDPDKWGKPRVKRTEELI